MFNNNEFRRSTRHTGGDFNLYGLDPEGRKTHLVMHMYGPWKPPTIPLVRFSGQSRPPPRFGPPSSEQLAWLPATFVQRDPPTYYGTPCLPYLPPPLTFDYTRFDALIPKPRGRIDNGTERTQPLVAVDHGIWSLTVMYTVGGGLHAYEFTIWSSMTWEEFEAVARTYLQLWRTSSELGYRVHKDGTLGRLGKLRNGSDWRKAMKRFGLPGGIITSGELVIYNLDDVHGISNKELAVETHTFDYPTVDDLLRLVGRLSIDETGEGAPPFINERERQGLRIAGLYAIDNFIMLSPVELSIVSQIIPEKVKQLYTHVEDMLKHFHNEKKGDIESIIQLRNEGKGLV